MLRKMTTTASELARAAFDHTKAAKVVGSTPVSNEPTDQAFPEVSGSMARGSERQ
jgi:hypothetical protein